MMEHEVLDYDEPTLRKIGNLLHEAELLSETLRGARHHALNRILYEAREEVRAAYTTAVHTPNEPEPKDKYNLSDEEATALGDIALAVGRYDLGRPWAHGEDYT